MSCRETRQDEALSIHGVPSFFQGSIVTARREMTRKLGKEEIGKRLEKNGLDREKETGNNVVEKVLVRKKRKRLPSMERLRHELVYQLRESLRASQEKMNNPELTLTERHHLTQVHTYTAQVFNIILRDLQMKDWEERLKFIEGRRQHQRDS